MFEAKQEDVDAGAQGRNKPIVLGQVGIRCIHVSRAILAGSLYVVLVGIHYSCCLRFSTSVLGYIQDSGLALQSTILQSWQLCTKLLRTLSMFICQSSVKPFQRKSDSVYFTWTLKDPPSEAERRIGVILLKFKVSLILHMVCASRIILCRRISIKLKPNQCVAFCLPLGNARMTRAASARRNCWLFSSWIESNTEAWL